MARISLSPARAAAAAAAARMPRPDILEETEAMAEIFSARAAVCRRILVWLLRAAARGLLAA
ncbi:MAG: hypothetical protein HC902_13625 [Calothrix sp. SM1_5_4]|nr:hypothetical protein [Calothrix sp. SM1_5_4]